MLAAIRPDSWNYALFVHVLGAMILVGALVTAGTAQVLSWRPGGDAAAYARLAFRTLLFVGVPAWFVMRIGAEWIYSKEKWADVPNEPDWLGVGYITADLGGILLLVSVVSGRVRRSPACPGRRWLDDPRQVGGRYRAGRPRAVPRRPLGDDREARLGTVTP